MLIPTNSADGTGRRAEKSGIKRSEVAGTGSGSGTDAPASDYEQSSHAGDLHHQDGRDSKQEFDLTEIVNANSFRFPIRFAVLVTGLLWFLSGSQITLTLFVTMEPPRFPVCAPAVADLRTQAKNLPDVPALPNPAARSLQGPAATACNPDVPLNPMDCVSDYTYKHPGVSVVSDFDIQTAACESRPWNNTSWLHSALFGGILFGSLFVAPLCDRTGRRPILTVGTLLIAGSAVWSTLSPNVYMYGISRFLVGVGCASSGIPSMVLLSELIPTSKRQWVLGVQAVAFAVAASYVAILSCLIPSWRIVTILAALPSCYFAFGCVCCSGVYIESPKWLSAKGRMQESFNVWLKMAAVNGTELPDRFTLDHFTRLELGSMHDVNLRTKDDVDEELSLMSVQQLAVPDKLSKALTTFPLSIWMFVSVWMWVVAALVYYGVLLDFGNVLFSEPSAAQRSLQEFTQTAGQLVTAVAPTPPVAVAAQLVTQPGIATQPASQLVTPPSVTPPSVTPPSAAPILPGYTVALAQAIASITQPLVLPVAPSLAPLNFSVTLPALVNSVATRVPQVANESTLPPQTIGTSLANRPPAIPAVAEANLSAPGTGSFVNPAAEYLRYVGDLVGNESKIILESARNFPGKAGQFYSEYGVNEKWNSLFSDMTAQFHSQDAMAGYWRKVRLNGLVIIGSFASEIPSYVVAMRMAISPLFGRKRTTSLLFGLAAVFLVTASCMKYVEFGSLSLQNKVVITLAIIGRSFIAAVFLLIYLYCAEMVPTSIRASSLGLYSAIARIGCVFAAPLSSALDSAREGSALLMFGLISLFAASITLTTLPETLDKPLYDTIETLELAYEREGFKEWFYSNYVNLGMACVIRNTCCIGRTLGKCLGIRSDDGSPRNFEDRGRAWIRGRWSRSKEGSRFTKFAGKAKEYGLFSTGGSSKHAKSSKFMPLHDMHDETEGRFRNSPEFNNPY